MIAWPRCRVGLYRCVGSELGVEVVGCLGARCGWRGFGGLVVVGLAGWCAWGWVGVVERWWCVLRRDRFPGGNHLTHVVGLHAARSKARFSGVAQRSVFEPSSISYVYGASIGLNNDPSRRTR